MSHDAADTPPAAESVETILPRIRLVPGGIPDLDEHLRHEAQKLLGVGKPFQVSLPLEVVAGENDTRGHYYPVKRTRWTVEVKDADQAIRLREAFGEWLRTWVLEEQGRTD